MTGVSEISRVETIKYERELIQDFQLTEGKLRRMVSTRGWAQGTTKCRLEVLDPAGRASERMGNGDLPYKKRGIRFVETDLIAEYSGDRLTDYTEFTQNSGYRDAFKRMQAQECHNSIDYKIYETLKGAARQYRNGTAVLMDSVDRCADIVKELQNQNVEADGQNVFGVLPPGEYLRLTKSEKVASRDYTQIMPLHKGAGPTEAVKILGVIWTPWNGLDGIGTNACQGFVFHRNSIAHYLNGDPSVEMGWNSEHRYHFSNAGVMHGCGRVLERGLMRVTYDDSQALAA